MKKPKGDPLRNKEGAELPEPPYVTGGPPFPAHPTDDGRYGMSILDCFAAHVITGLCARDNLTIDELKLNGARDAYWIAAMMVDLRNGLPIEPTPVPTNEEPPPEVFPPPLPAEAALVTTVRLDGPQPTIPASAASA